MKKLGALVVVFAFTAAACSHKQPNQAEASRAPINEESEVTGQPAVPVYPRATLVSLPSSTPAVASSPVPAAIATTDSATPNSTTAVDVGSYDMPPSNASPASPSAEAPNSALTSETAPSGMPSPGESSTVTNSATTAAVELTNAPNAAVRAAPEGAQVVVLQTTLGRLVLQLDEFAAPKTCANFRSLVASGFYNGTIFHRVIPHFIIQGGDPNSKTDNRATYGQGDPGYTLPPEIKLSHDRGAVAMARLPDLVNPQRDSNGSQFYICVEPCPSLDDQYTVFAHVIQGMDVAEKIADAPRDSRDDPLTRIAMDARLEPKDQALQKGAAVSH